jgi:hypothetical protein
VSRANNDLVIFILVGLALLALRKDSRTGYYFAAAILAVAAALKYYPLAAVVVLYSAGSRRQFFAALAIYAGVLLLAAPSLPEALEAAARYKPRPEWLYAFGAPMLWRNFHWEGSTLWIVPALAVIAWAWPRRPMNSVRAEIGSGTAEARAFLVGSTLIVGCFFLGASYAYKLVFSLWLLPGLWRASASGFAPRAAQVTSALLYFVLWFEGSAAALLNLAPVVLSSETVDRSLKSVLTIQQISTWALMACLLRWIFAAVFSQAKTLLRSPARA